MITTMKMTVSELFDELINSKIDRTFLTDIEILTIDRIEKFLNKVDSIDLDDLQSALGYLYSGCELFNQQREEPTKTLQLGITLRETNKLKNLIDTLKER